MRIKSLIAAFIVFISAISFSVFAVEVPEMSEKAAHAIAYEFFRQKYGEVGGVAEGINRKGSWEFQPYTGVEAKFTYRKIRVNKKTGKASFAYSWKNTIKVIFPDPV